MNRVTLIGRLTKEPEVMKTQSGLSVINFTLAVRKNRKTDAGPDADFIQCQAWRQSADYLGAYAHKGSQVAVDGSIQTRSYMKDETRVYVTEVIAERVEILAQKPKEADSEANPGRMENESSYGNYGGYEAYSTPEMPDPDNLPF